jgi:hypothetical protein
MEREVVRTASHFSASGFRAFSSEVDAGSREENASNKEMLQRYRFNLKR